MLKFERKEGTNDDGSRWASWEAADDEGDELDAEVFFCSTGIYFSGRLDSPVDLAELERVIHEAAVVAGWKEKAE